MTVSTGVPPEFELVLPVAPTDLAEPVSGPVPPSPVLPNPPLPRFAVGPVDAEHATVTQAMLTSR
jgi:hypothetical protein